MDDILYFAEPMFQDGIIAQAVDQVVADGVSYFSSAGNDGRDAYESAFNPSNQSDLIFGTLHDFNPGMEPTRRFSHLFRGRILKAMASRTSSARQPPLPMLLVSLP